VLLDEGVLRGEVVRKIFQQGVLAVFAKIRYPNDIEALTLLTADRDTFVGALTRTGEAGLSDVAPFVLGVFLSWLVIRGAGALSVDAILKRVIGPSGTPKKEDPGPA